VADAEVEYAGPALRTRLLLFRGQIGVAAVVREDPDYWVFDTDIIYVPSLVK
jgi:hypothetical protein